MEGRHEDTESSAMIDDCAVEMANVGLGGILWEPGELVEEGLGRVHLGTIFRVITELLEELITIDHADIETHRMVDGGTSLISRIRPRRNCTDATCVPDKVAVDLRRVNTEFTPVNSTDRIRIPVGGASVRRITARGNRRNGGSRRDQ